MAFSDPPGAPRKTRPKISLKMQAIGFLSRREHSRQELRAKLLEALRKRDRDHATQAEVGPVIAADMAAAAATAEAGPSNGIDAAFAPEASVDQLLDWLVAHKYLSDTRFVESRVHARAQKQGATRIRHELARHGLTLEPEQAAALRETEFTRAQAIWQRKFGAVAQDARERARQARFLASRGFDAGVVRRLVGGEEEF